MDKPFFEKYKTSEVTNTRSVINTPSAFTGSIFFISRKPAISKA